MRLGSYSTNPSAVLPPAAIVATKAMRRDPRAEPKHRERVPYVIAQGVPGTCGALLLLCGRSLPLLPQMKKGGTTGGVKEQGEGVPYVYRI